MLKADKKKHVLRICGMVWFRLQMIDLYKLRSSDRTAWEGRLFHCTTAKGKKEYL